MVMAHSFCKLSFHIKNMKNTTVIELVSQYIQYMQEVESFPASYGENSNTTYYVARFKHGKGSKRYKWNIINDADPLWADRFCKTLMYRGCGYQLNPTDELVVIQFTWEDNAGFRYVQNVTLESDYSTLVKERATGWFVASVELVWTITNVGDLMCVNT